MKADACAAHEQTAPNGLITTIIQRERGKRVSSNQIQASRTTTDRTLAQQMIDHLLNESAERPAITRFLGIRGVECQPGSFTLECDATGDLTAHIDVVHGGILTTLLDTAMGYATLTVLNAGELFATTDLHVQLLQAAKVGRIRATGTVVRRTRQVVFCESSAFDAQGNLVTRAWATNQVIKAG